MNTTGLLAAGVAASLSMATVPHAAAQERSLDEIKKEAYKPGSGSVGAAVVQDRPRLRGKCRRACRPARRRGRAGSALYARVRVLPGRPLSRAEHRR